MTRCGRRALTAAVALLLADAAHASASKDDLARERRLASRVSRDRALEMVKRLVTEGPRMGGTPSGDRAAALVAAWLKEAGLPVDVVDDPPRLVHEETAWTVELAGKPLASAWPYGYSPSLPLAAYPIALDDALPAEGAQPGKPLAGRVLLTSRGLEVLKPAAEAGAVAVLTDHPADPNRFVDWAPIVEIPRMLRQQGKEAAIPMFGLSYRDGQALRTAAAAAPLTVSISLVSSVREGRPRTVIATLAGAGARREEVVLVCAHGDSDSGGPGADDNASGVAALIELARALAQAAAAGELPSDRPQVRFAVWGSELHSSHAYIRSHEAELARHLAVFNYDQAGFGSARDALYYEGNDVPWNAPLLRTLESIAGDHAGQSGFWTIHTSNPSLGGTDMYVFLPQRYQGTASTDLKIPVTTVFTAAWDRPTIVEQTPGWQSAGWPETGPLFVDYSAYYHSSGDRPERTTEVEPHNMERCARLVLLSILRLMEGRAVSAPTPATAPVPPPSPR
ncbi:MAG: M28 family peptidase [Candidatus Polarisedimenticolia bacterium]